MKSKIGIHVTIEIVVDDSKMGTFLNYRFIWCWTLHGAHLELDVSFQREQCICLHSTVSCCLLPIYPLRNGSTSNKDLCAISCGRLCWRHVAPGYSSDRLETFNSNTLETERTKWQQVFRNLFATITNQLVAPGTSLVFWYDFSILI